MPKMRTDGVSWQEIDGELVILDLVNSVYLTTNESGGFLTQLLAQGCQAEQLTTALADRFGVNLAVAAEDVDAFVAALRARRLLVRD